MANPPTESSADNATGRRAHERSLAEHWIETILFNSRWLLAPFYVALVAVLAVLLVKMGQQVFHFIMSAPNATEADVILEALSLIDLTLMGSLVIIVIFSGYENFVSKIDESDHKDWPEWMGKIDFSALKLKLLSSIVAISAIKLLSAFMKVQSYSDRELIWSVGIHLVFVTSGLIMAWTDRISGEH